MIITNLYDRVRTYDVGEVRDDGQMWIEAALKHHCCHDNKKQQLKPSQQLVSDAQCESHHCHAAQQKLQTNTHVDPHGGPKTLTPLYLTEQGVSHTPLRGVIPPPNFRTTPPPASGGNEGERGRGGRGKGKRRGEGKGPPRVGWHPHVPNPEKYPVWLLKRLNPLEFRGNYSVMSCHIKIIWSWYTGRWWVGCHIWCWDAWWPS